MSDYPYYPCWNHERRSGAAEYPVQDGWTDDGRRKMRMHTEQRLPVQCGHMLASTDPKCTGCRWLEGGFGE